MTAVRGAIVTGASRGIGRACALALARAGFAVYLVADGTREALEAAAAECAAQSADARRSAWGIYDLARPAAAEAIVAAATAAVGRIDVLVNNAGIRLRQPFGEITADDFDRVVAVNLRAPLLLSQAVLPAMRAAGGGRIIHMASQLGLVVDAGTTVYSLTKAALIQLTRSMALELAPLGIQVNAVSPGPIDTSQHGGTVARDPGLLARRLAAIPAGRLGREDEIADVVTYLATTPATFLQGHNLVVDGGFIIH